MLEISIEISCVNFNPSNYLEYMFSFKRSFPSAMTNFESAEWMGTYEKVYQCGLPLTIYKSGGSVLCYTGDVFTTESPYLDSNIYTYMITAILVLVATTYTKAADGTGVGLGLLGLIARVIASRGWWAWRGWGHGSFTGGPKWMMLHPTFLEIF